MAEYADTNGNVYSDDEMEDRYEEFLNEVYSAFEVGELSYEAGRVLRQIDYIAFREGFNNWIDSECQDGQYLDLSLSENTTCDTCDRDLTAYEAVTSFTDETGPICTECLEGDDDDDDDDDWEEIACSHWGTTPGGVRVLCTRSDSGHDTHIAGMATASGNFIGNISGVIWD